MIGARPRVRCDAVVLVVPGWCGSRVIELFDAS
jgi:hypothetical protein